LYHRGAYVRIDVQGVKLGHYKKFKPEVPLIICRVNPGEGK
jgi:hypothetical protein